MNYLSKKTAKYSFNWKGDCFLSLEDKNDRIKFHSIEIDNVVYGEKE